MSEYHVCGLLVMSRPEQAPAVERALRSMAGVELHASVGGRMVVTIEGAAYGQCADLMTELATLEGVASSALVYHHIDHASRLEEAAP